MAGPPRLRGEVCQPSRNYEVTFALGIVVMKRFGGFRDSEELVGGDNMREWKGSDGRK